MAVQLVVCQVVDMDVEEQWVLWYNEETLNLDGSDGTHPKMIISRASSSRTIQLFYCYYKPKTSKCTKTVCNLWIIALITRSFVIWNYFIFVIPKVPPV